MNRRHVMRFVVAGLLTGLAATGAAGAAGTLAAPHPSGKHGVLRGAIYRAGGPKPDPSSRAAKEAGVVSVYSLGGRKVARRSVRAGHDFRFTLRPGVYRVVAGKSLHPRGGCGATRVRVRAGRTARANVRTGCSTP